MIKEVQVRKAIKLNIMHKIGMNTSTRHNLIFTNFELLKVCSLTLSTANRLLTLRSDLYHYH